VSPAPGGWYEVFTPYISAGTTAYKCLDDPHGSGTNGQPLVIWHCHSGTNQLWTFSLVSGTTNVYRIFNMASDLCLGVADTFGTPGTPLEQTGCDRGGYTEWQLDSPFEADHFLLESVQFPGECAAASSASSDPNTSASVLIGSCNPGSAHFQQPLQTWGLG
jgi:hypothetical protein